MRDAIQRVKPEFLKYVFHRLESDEVEEEEQEQEATETNIVENESGDNITLTATRVRESFQAIF